MKPKKYLFLLCLFVVLFPLFLVLPVFAHGGDPRIEISSERLNPGAVLSLRGVDFAFEEQVVLSLVGPQIEIQLGEVIADTEGIFLVNMTLPVDIAEGTYVVRATTDDHIVESPQIHISGMAELGNDENSQRAEEDPLLAPMPKAINEVSTAVPSTPIESKSSPVENSFNPIVWVAAGIGIILVLGLIFRMKN